MKRFDPMATYSPSVVGETLAEKHLSILANDIRKYYHRKKFNKLYDSVINVLTDINK